MKTHLKKSISIEFLYYVAYSLFLFLIIISRTFYFQYIIGAPYKLGLAFCISIITVKELIFFRNSRKMIIGWMLCFVIMIAYVITDMGNRNIMIFSLFMVFAGRKCKFEDICKVTAYVGGITLLFVVASSFIGIIPNYSYNTGDRVRHYVGFLYALTPATITWNLTTVTILWRRTKIKWLEIAALFAINFLIYYQTRSRLTFLLSIVVLLFAIYKKIKKNKIMPQKISKLLTKAPIICAVFSIITAVIYNPENKIMSSCNDILEDRLRLAHDAFVNYGIKPFGTKFDMVGNGLDPYGNNTSIVNLAYSYIDNMYVQLLVRYGLFLFLIFMALLIIADYRAAKIDKDGYIQFTMFVLAVQNTIQDSFLAITGNTLMFAVCLLMISKSNNVVSIQEQLKRLFRIQK